MCVASFPLNLGDDDGSFHSLQEVHTRLSGLKKWPIEQRYAPQAWRKLILARRKRREKCAFLGEKGEDHGCKHEGGLGINWMPNHGQVQGEKAP